MFSFTRQQNLEVPLANEQLTRLYQAMRTAREVDSIEKQWIRQGLAHFHVSGAGHEASAALARHLTPGDWIHAHYRDKALLIARGVPFREFLASLLCRASSHSVGRQMSAHLSAPELNVLSIVGPVGNNALQACGVAAALSDKGESGLVVCSVGDGTTQQGEFLEAIAEAVRWKLPVLFLIHDNGFSISTETFGKTFFSRPDGDALNFYGLPIHRANGADVQQSDAVFGDVVQSMRSSPSPQLVLLQAERLDDHTNADNQLVYRDAERLAAARIERDSLLNLRATLAQLGLSPADLDQYDFEIAEEVRNCASKVLREPEPTSMLTCKAPYPDSLLLKSERRGSGSTRSLSMREAILGTLQEHLASDDRVFLYGQDIEDPKGDVFGVTRGLSSEFPGRVVNAPLSESTIVGTAIGRALAGQRPIAFLQFADFLPLAFNQFASELATMYWRTCGGWQCPVIVMATCGGYKPGLGPFHAQTMDGLATHIPGIDVFMPSNATDAAGLLNAALASPRPTLFLYPKTCLNSREGSTSTGLALHQHFVPPGRAYRLAHGKDLTLVTWGNPVGDCIDAVRKVETLGFTIDLFDLRSLSPWDEAAIIASAARTGRLLVVHEDNLTGGFGAEVIATITEHSTRPMQVRRVARADTYIPFHFPSQIEVLPSFSRILDAMAKMLGCIVTWTKPLTDPAGHVYVRAIGSGPADDCVKVVALLVKVEDAVNVGDCIAEVEATKATIEVCATTSGIVVEILVQPGDDMLIGAPIVLLRTGERKSQSIPPMSRQDTGNREAMLIPTITHRDGSPRHADLRGRDMLRNLSTEGGRKCRQSIFISGIASSLGDRTISNEDIVEHSFPNRNAGEIERLTGIKSRPWASENQTVLSLAVDATSSLLERQQLSITDIDLLIACTTTPDRITPALACRVASEIAGSYQISLAAYDINAACSGYLYALSQAWSYLRQYSRARVIVVTSELLSRLLNPHDFNTSIVFADAATATLVTATPPALMGAGEESGNTDVASNVKTRMYAEAKQTQASSRNTGKPTHSHLTISRPVISGKPHGKKFISVPLAGDGYIQMQGNEVFREAVRAMIDAVERACTESNMTTSDLGLIVPHQANRRIFDAIARRTGCQIYDAIKHLGNTSSSSIPLALEQLAGSSQFDAFGTMALCAYGGGATSAAAIVSCYTKTPKALMGTA